MHDDYKPLDAGNWTPLEPCPVCGSEAALWQYSKSETTPRKLLVCCTHGDAIGPQDGLTSEGCLLYMPPDNFYRETIRDAVRYWSDFAKAMVALRARGVMAAEAQSIFYADKIAFESAMKAGKGCDVWPTAGDYEQRTGRKLVALQAVTNGVEPAQAPSMTRDQVQALARKVGVHDPVTFDAMTRLVNAALAAYGVSGTRGETFSPADADAREG